MLEIRLSAALIDSFWLSLRNLTILLQSPIRVVPTEGGSSVEFRVGQRSLTFPLPHLDAWRANRIRILNWRGIDLPQPLGGAGDEIDLLGLVYFLSEDLEARHFEANHAGERFVPARSAFAILHKANYLDQMLLFLKNDLAINSMAPFGVILTHDLDILAARRPNPPGRSRLVTYLRRGLRKGLRVLERTRFPRFESFEFIDWAAAEESFGFRSVFFVFAPSRKRSSRHDGWYDFDFRDRNRPLVSLRRALRGLLRKGHMIGPHLSLSSGYQADEIEREFGSVSRSLNIPIKCVRNHWLYIKYSDWYNTLSRLGVEFDFNQATVGYCKGTAFPLFSANKTTMVFPTTFMDDVVLKPSKLHYGSREALTLARGQLNDVKVTGGCIALSFHPAEDGPPGFYEFGDKLTFYRKVLQEIDDMRIPVLTPEQAKKLLNQYELSVSSN